MESQGSFLPPSSRYGLLINHSCRAFGLLDQMIDCTLQSLVQTFNGGMIFLKFASHDI
jgi:hypothetical protein